MNSVIAVPGFFGIDAGGAGPFFLSFVAALALAFPVKRLPAKCSCPKLRNQIPRVQQRCQARTHANELTNDGSEGGLETLLRTIPDRKLLAFLC